MRTVTNKVTSRADEIRVRTITRGPIPYDGREGSSFALEQKRSRIQQTRKKWVRMIEHQFGISHLIGIPSSLKIHRSELLSKERKLCITCRREAGPTGESLDSSHVVSWGIGRSDGSGGNGSVVADLFDPTVQWERLITVPEVPGTIPSEVKTERWEFTRSSSRTSVDKHFPYDGYWRKGINLEIDPRLEKSIRSRYPRIGGR